MDERDRLGRMNERITAIIVDDHEVVLVGLRMILERGGIEVIGECRSGREAVWLASQKRPDVVVMDILMPDIDGLEALQQIREAAPETHVIMTTGHSDIRYIRESLRMGAAGYITKDEPPDGIVAAIRSVVEGGAAVSRPALRGALEKGGQKDLSELSSTAELDTELTPQQTKVAALVGLGLDNSEISEELFISIHTVRSHIQEIYARTGISDRTQLALWSVRQGLTS